MSDAVHRDLFARTYAQGVAQVYFGQRHVDFLAVAYYSCSFWFEADQAFDCFRGTAARPHFQRLAQNNQAGHHGNDVPERFGGAGRKELRGNGDDKGIAPGCTQAHSDQRIHGGVVVAQGFPGADEKLRAGIEHDGKRQQRQ